MKFKTFIATFGLAALTLTACGNQDSSPEDQDDVSEDQDSSPEDAGQDGQQGQDQSELMGHGAYALEHEGAEISFELPANEDDPEIEELEQYREDVKADPVTYIVADVDNRNGQEHINMYQVEVFDEDGASYTFGSVDEHFGDIMPETDWSGDAEESTLADGTVVPEQEGTELYNRGVDLTNEHLDGVDVAGRDTIVLVYDGDDLPDEFTRVAVWPSGGFEDVDAYPME